LQADAEIDVAASTIRLGSAIGPLAFSFAGGAEFE
jgi:hypothetical protein